MSSRLTRLTGITAGTLLSGGLLLGGAAPAFADNTNNATVNGTNTNTQSNSATVTQTATGTASGNSQTAGPDSINVNAGVATNVSKIRQTNRNRFSIRVRQSNDDD